MKRKILSIFFMLLIPFSLSFGYECSNGFVLGAKILKFLGLPIYSNINTGVYFPGIIALILLAIGWVGSKKLFKKEYPQLADNILWYVLLLAILIKLI